MSQGSIEQIEVTCVTDGQPRSVPKKGIVDFGDEESPPRPPQAEESNSEGKRRTG